MSKTKAEEHNCYTCDWYYDWFGVCCNGDCEYCADCPPYPERKCKYWKEKKQNTNDLRG